MEYLKSAIGYLDDKKLALLDTPRCSVLTNVNPEKIILESEIRNLEYTRISIKIQILEIELKILKLTN
jgi:hypothetical protein